MKHGTQMVTMQKESSRANTRSTLRQEYSPVAVATSQYLLVLLAILKPPGRERLAANCSAPASFQIQIRSFLVQPSETREHKFELKWEKIPSNPNTRKNFGRNVLWTFCYFPRTASNKHKLGSFPLGTGQYSVLCEGQIMSQIWIHLLLVAGGFIDTVLCK